MLCRTIAALLCTLVLLRVADCRLHRRHHYRDEVHPHRIEDHLILDENHQLLFEKRHQPIPQPGEDLHQSDSDHQRLGEIHNQQPNSEVQQRRDELLALEHSERVTEFSTCAVPRPQVVHVSDHHPGRYFLPHCTVLHRCGRHSGCCGTDQLRCVAVSREKVVLPFYSVRAEDIRPGGRAVRRVEKLEFTNHTRCGCAPDHEAVSRNDL